MGFRAVLGLIRPISLFPVIKITGNSEVGRANALALLSGLGHCLQLLSPPLKLQLNSANFFHPVHTKCAASKKQRLKR